jgi:hypothetical protein
VDLEAAEGDDLPMSRLDGTQPAPEPKHPAGGTA